MKDLVLTLFGSYEPVTQLVDGVAVPLDGLAGIDWPWLVGVFLFAIVLYSFFRLVGVMLRG